MMGIGGALNFSITSSIMAGAGDVGSLAGGHDLCMTGVLSAPEFLHMWMEGCCVPFWPEVTLLVVPPACKVVDLVQVLLVFPCPRGGLENFGSLPSCPMVPLGLR